MEILEDCMEAEQESKKRSVYFYVINMINLFRFFLHILSQYVQFLGNIKIYTWLSDNRIFINFVDLRKGFEYVE